MKAPLRWTVTCAALFAAGSGCRRDDPPPAPQKPATRVAVATPPPAPPPRVEPALTVSDWLLRAESSDPKAKVAALRALGNFRKSDDRQLVPTL